jgi:hypothetical protein
VYGVPNARLTLREVSLGPAACPAPTWSSGPLWSSSGPIELASTSSIVLLARPDPSGRAIDAYALAGASLALLATATVTADGPLAAEQAPDGSLRVAEGAPGGTIAVLAFDGAHLRPRATLSLGGRISTGGSDPIDALAFAPGSLDLFASASGHAPALQRFRSSTVAASGFLPPEPALLIDIAAHGLLLAPILHGASPDLIVADDSGLSVYRGRAGGRLDPTPELIPGPCCGISIAPLIDPRELDVVLSSNDGLAVIRPLEPLAIDTTSSIGGSRTLAWDANQDGRADLLVLGGTSLNILLGDGRGDFLNGAECPIAGSPSGLVTVSSGSTRAVVTSLLTTHQLVILGPSR